jgi:hypothetical protein
LGIGGYLFVSNVNSIVKQGIEKAAPEMLQAPVDVASVDISILSGRGEIRGLKVGNPNGYKGSYAFELERILLEMDPVSLGTDTVHIKSLIIDSPLIAYEGNLKDSNIQQLQRNVEALINSRGNLDGQETKTANGESRTRLQLDYFAITNANASVELAFLSGDPLRLQLSDIELRDIGKAQDKSAAEVLDNILANFNRSLIIAIEQNAGGISDQLEEKGREMEGKVKRGLDKLKSILGN